VLDEQWGQQIVAAVVRRPGADGAALEAETVRDWARTHLRGSRTPDRVLWVGELPYSPTGKLLRREVGADAAAPAP
jgi:acyl-CoA synthetase (AMP-forming)/AMP-acid ligase II